MNKTKFKNGKNKTVVKSGMMPEFIAPPPPPNTSTVVRTLNVRPWAAVYVNKLIIIKPFPRGWLLIHKCLTNI